MTIRHIHFKTAALTSMVALLCAFAVSTQPVRAIDGESIVMSPASKPLKVDASQSVNDKFTILNDGTVGYTFKVYAAPYSVENGSYDSNFTDRAENADIYRWVTFDKTEYHLEPGQRVDVSYQLNVPSDASSGGHYGVIFAETQEPASSGSINRKKRVGMIMYTTVSGDVVMDGREVSVRLDPIQIGYPLSGAMTVENTGNTDFTMTKTLRVKSIFGGTLYEKTLDHIILPKTTRDIPLTWENGAWLGWYNVEASSTILGKTSVHSQLVFITPAWFLILAIAVIALAVYVLVRRRRR